MKRDKAIDLRERERTRLPGRRRPSTLLKGLGKRLSATTMVVALLGSLGWVQTSPAHAETVYEIVGQWHEGTHNPLQKGDKVSSVWRFNINDDGPVPSNDPVDNVTVTFTAHGGVFQDVPKACLTQAADTAVPLSPVSEITDGGKTLVCNIGTREQGSAELMLTGLQVTGESGDVTFVEAEIGGVEAQLPPLPILNVFAMDMKFDGGSASTRDGALQEVSFPWSLRHSPGGEPGPDTVEYTLTFTNTSGSGLNVTPTDACKAITNARAGHPFSDTAHVAERTAPFPGNCSFTRVGTSNKFKLSISGIDYGKDKTPTYDSEGTALPSEWDVVAAGEVRLSFTYDKAGTLGFVASAPTYIGTVTGTTSKDIGTNNENSRAYTRGSWTGGWVLGQVGLPGSVWVDTSRAGPGDLVRASAGVAAPSAQGATSGVCSVLDTKYVDFVGVQTGYRKGGEILPYPGGEGIKYWFYVGNGVGNNVNPKHANYDPNSFTCDTGWGGSDWVSVPPKDLSSVKAVRIHIPYSAAAGVSEHDAGGVARSFVDSRIKLNASAGQDIWQWTSYNMTGTASSGWTNPHRTMQPNDVPASGVKTPGTRYPYTGGGRDVLRVVSARPFVSKEADQSVVMPGATVQYTVKYRAESTTDMKLPLYTLTDTLPAGMEYVPGSASVEPSSVKGKKVTWKLQDVSSNTEYVLTYKARIADDAEPGSSYTNDIVAELNGLTAAAADTVKIRDGGYVQLTKTSAARKVAHNGGVAENSWTVRVTSHDSKATSFTDTIDVLPFNGDGRGTEFAGAYVLKAPVQAVSGAKVYYTTDDPKTLNDDPDHASNGKRGTVTGNTVHWSTTFTKEATAVRVIGPELRPSQQQEFTVSVVTAGAEHDDRYVNRAEARSDRHQLKMRTSDSFTIGAANSVTIKKYVQSEKGEWHDANDIDDYPSYRTGDTVPYRLVVTNTGDETLKNLVVEDDRVDLAGLKPLPNGLTLVDGKAVIGELLPGEDHQVTIEYSVVLASGTEAGSLVNTACVVPDPGEPEEGTTPAEEDCDPAGITVLPSSLSWKKVAAGTSDTEYLAGSEWELTPVDANDKPTGESIAVADCIADAASECKGPDRNPSAGEFLLDPLDDGRYRLVETRAPAGYQLDPTPRYIDVLGETSFEKAIENKQSEVPHLPLTGGVGTLAIFLGAGGAGALALAALAVQRRRSRMSLNES